MPNNLRVIYNNLADSGTIVTAGSTFNTSSSVDGINYPISNLFKDTKAMVWRSAWTTNTVTITIGWTTPQSISSIVLPYTNLSTSTTMAINFFNNAGATGAPASTLAAASCVPVDLGLSTPDATGSFKFSYGGGNYARRYFTATTCQSIAITITDTTPITTFAELSRLIIGTYWSPTYNTEFGLSVIFNDLSQHSRSQAGNLLTDTGVVCKSINFATNFLTASDRNTLYKLLFNNGKRKSVFLTLFPEDTDTSREAQHQVFGRISDNVTMTHPMYSFYAASMQIDEV